MIAIGFEVREDGSDIPCSHGWACARTTNSNSLGDFVEGMPGGKDMSNDQFMDEFFIVLDLKTFEWIISTGVFDGSHCSTVGVVEAVGSMDDFCVTLSGIIHRQNEVSIWTH